MPIKEWIEKRFKYANDIMASENDIAYTNTRCQAAGNEVRKRLGFKKGKYEAVGFIRMKRQEQDIKKKEMSEL